MYFIDYFFIADIIFSICFVLIIKIQLKSISTIDLFNNVDKLQAFFVF